MFIKNQMNDAGTHKFIIDKNGGGQWRLVGKRSTQKSPLGRSIYSFGAIIDQCIFDAKYTKIQIQKIAGCQESKLRSHIAHLKRKFDLNVLKNPMTNILSFEETPQSKITLIKFR